MFTHCISHCCCIISYSESSSVCSHTVSLTVIVLSCFLQPNQFCVFTHCISHCCCIISYSQSSSVCSHTVSLTVLVLSCFLQPNQFCVFTHCISHCYCIELFSTAKDVLCVHTLYLSLLLYWVVFYSQTSSVCSHTVSLTAIVSSCFLQPKMFCVFTHCISHCYCIVFYSQTSSVCSHTVWVYLSLLLYRVVFYSQRCSVCSHTVSLTAVVSSCFLQPKEFCVFTHCISHCCCIKLFSTTKGVLCVHILYLSLQLYRVVFYNQRSSVCSHTVSLTAVVSSCFLQPKEFCVFTHCISHCYCIVFYNQRSSVCSHTVSLTAIVLFSTTKGVLCVHTLYLSLLLYCFLQPKEFCAMFLTPPPTATPCPVYMSVSFLNNYFLFSLQSTPLSCLTATQGKRGEKADFYPSTAAVFPGMAQTCS